MKISITFAKKNPPQRNRKRNRKREKTLLFGMLHTLMKNTLIIFMIIYRLTLSAYVDMVTNTVHSNALINNTVCA